MNKNPNTAVELVRTPSGTVAAARFRDAYGKLLPEIEIEAILLRDEINSLGKRIMKHIANSGE